jgi:hypothetical protein
MSGRQNHFCTGIRNSNDLVWVGRAPNIAAKLSSFREAGFASYITADVFAKLNDSAKFFNGTAMSPKNELPAHPEACAVETRTLAIGIFFPNSLSPDFRLKFWDRFWIRRRHLAPIFGRWHPNPPTSSKSVSG